MLNRYRSSLHGFVSMDTTFRTIPVFFLLYLPIQFGCCYGTIFLCLDNSGLSHNGTSVWAEIGQPVSVSFCVDTDSQVFPYIKIEQPYGTGDWYSNSRQGRIAVRMVNAKTRATINITINPVKRTDFSSRFYVTVYKHQNINSHLLLWFQLQEKKSEIWLCPSGRATPTTVDARLGVPASFSLCAETNGTFSSDSDRLIRLGRIGLNKIWYRNPHDDYKIYVNISQVLNQILVNVTIKQVQHGDFNGTFNVTVYNTEGKNMTVPFQLMELKGETVQGKVESTSTTVSTQQSPSSKVGGATPSSGPQCLPRIGSGCPEGWSPVDDHRCLNVMNRIAGVYAVNQCTQAGGSLIAPRDIVELRSCLEYLLENSGVKVVGTNGTNYNVRTGEEVSRTSDYMVACLVGRIQVTTTASGHVESTTAARLRCLPQVGSGCPEGFYPVDNNTCLNVFPPPLPSDYYSPRCEYFDVRLIYDKAIKPCLEDLFDKTTVKVLQVNGIYYNVSTGKLINPRTPVYMVACLVDKRRFVQPTITEFYMESKPPRMRKTVLIPSDYDAIHDVSNGCLRVVCSARGLPVPEVTLLRDNLTLPNSSGGVLTITTPSCLDSGLYACHARNVVNSTQAQRKIQFTSPVKIEPVQIINRTGNTDIRLGDHVTVRCSVTGCPSPDILTLANDANLTLGVFGKSSVIHEISSVQCSDMGAYLCRVETDGQETRADLRVDGCPIQLCRGQNKSVTIPRNLNQTTGFSVCLMSDEMPTWENTYGSRNIYVTFTRRIGSSIYFSADISVFKIEDNEAPIIVLRNTHSHLFYTLTLQPDERRSSVLDSHQQPPAQEQTSVLPIVLPLVFVVCIAFAVIGVVVYWKAKQYEAAIAAVSARLETSHTSGSGNNKNGTYENINGKEGDSSGYLMPVSSEQAATTEYSVILEY